MLMKNSAKLLALLLSLPLALACPGPFPDMGYHSPKPSTFSFALSTQGNAVAGGYGVTWNLNTDAPPSAALRWHLDGDGTLVSLERKTVGYSDPGLPAAGCYIPPAIAPASGTVQLWFEVYDAVHSRWETSPKYYIPVTSQNTPMSYQAFSGATNSASLLAGETASFGLSVYPRPLDLVQRTALVAPAGSPQDVGTANLTALDGAWSLNYQAPAVVPAPFNVIVQAIAYDPWYKVDRTLEFRVHVEPIAH